MVCVIVKQMEFSNGFMGILPRSRTSFFSGGPLCTRQDCIGAGHWLDKWYNSGAFGTTPSPDSTIKRQRKKSIIPESYRAHLEGGDDVRVEKNRCNNLEHKSRRPGLQKENRRPICRKERPPKRSVGAKEGSHETVSRKVKPRMRGTFYGKAQPPSFLQPVPQLQSYSDQSDCESLIDDADADPEDTGWVGELMETLGPYSTKDFSHIDKQRDRRMETSFHRIMEEERRTAKIGKEIDRIEAEKYRAEEKTRRRRQAAGAFIFDDF